MYDRCVHGNGKIVIYDVCTHEWVGTGLGGGGGGFESGCEHHIGYTRIPCDK